MKQIFKILSLLFNHQKKYLLCIYFILSLLAIFAEIVNVLILKYFILSILEIDKNVSSILNFQFTENDLLIIFIIIFVFSNLVQYSRDVFNKFYSNLTGLKILNEYYESIIKNKNFNFNEMNQINNTYYEINRFNQLYLFQILFFLSKITYSLALTVFILFLLKEISPYIILSLFLVLIIIKFSVEKFTFHRDSKFKSNLYDSAIIFQDLIKNFLEIKLFNLENTYLKVIQSNTHSFIFSRTVIEALILSSKYIIDILFIISLFIISKNISLDDNQLFSTGTIVIFLLYRLIPNLSSIMYSYITYKSNYSVHEQIEHYLNFTKLNKNIVTISKRKIKFPNTISIEIKKFSFSKDEILFKNFSANINLNKFTQIEGPNGSGKSTLLLILCGFIRDKNIVIKFNGQKVNFEKLGFLKEYFSYVPQSINLLNSSIKKNIILENKYDEKFFNFVCSELNIQNLLDKNIKVDADKKLSGGEKQKIAIARALYQKKPYLLLDEPFSSIDIKTLSIVQNLLKKTPHIKGILVISHQKMDKGFIEKNINLSLFKN